MFELAVLRTGACMLLTGRVWPGQQKHSALELYPRSIVKYALPELFDYDVAFHDTLGP